MPEQVNHPAHYGGGDNPYEAIKVIRAWGANFNVGNALKYLCRCGKKPGADAIDDLKKALWYIQDEINHREQMARESAEDALDAVERRATQAESDKAEAYALAGIYMQRVEVADRARDQWKHLYESLSEYVQMAVNHADYYRDLAIALGATPNAMLSERDKDLAAEGLPDKKREHLLRENGSVA